MKAEGWWKSVTVFGLILLVSLGLCWLNYAAFAHFNLGIGGPSVPGREQQEAWSGRLILTAMLELAGIIAGGLGLVISLIGAGVSAALRTSKSGIEKDY